MIKIIFFTLVGCAIGWNFPQPTYAKALQVMVKTKWAAFMKRRSVK